MTSEAISHPIDKEMVEKIGKQVLRDMYVTMVQIRIFEEKVADLVAAGEIICPCHLYIGQEAVATGVCASLTKEDFVYSTHRSHGHYIAKGGNLRTLMAELYGKATGCSKGHGGSMHLADPAIGFPGSSAIVAGTIPIAVGTALAFSLQGTDKVSVTFFGDGAATEGVFYESLNLASLKRLPVVFVCENNFYSTHMHISTIQANTDIYRRAEAFDIPAVRIDGNNIAEVFQTAKKCISDARQGKGPAFIECVTYRWRGHVGPNWDIEKGLRSQAEVDSWMKNCCIKRLEELLLSENMMSVSEKAKIAADISLEVEESLEYAKNSPFPDTASYIDQVFKEKGHR